MLKISYLLNFICNFYLQINCTLHSQIYQQKKNKLLKALGKKKSECKGFYLFYKCFYSFNYIDLKLNITLLIVVKK